MLRSIPSLYISHSGDSSRNLAIFSFTNLIVKSTSSSLVTEWVKGKTLDQALEIKNSLIAEELALPPVKIHCSILAEDAIKAAVADYKEKHPAK